MALQAAFSALVSGLVAALGGNVRPGIRPTVVTGNMPPREERIDRRTRPVPGTAFEPSVNDPFVSAFDGVSADGSAGGLKGRIVQWGFTFDQIGQRVCQGRMLRRRDRELLCHRYDGGCPDVLELVKLLG